MKRDSVFIRAVLVGEEAEQPFGFLSCGPSPLHHPEPAAARWSSSVPASRTSSHLLQVLGGGGLLPLSAAFQSIATLTDCSPNSWDLFSVGGEQLSNATWSACWWRCMRWWVGMIAC